VTDEVVAQRGSGSWLDLSNENSPHEAKLLSLNISKAKLYLKWIPVWGKEKAIEKTVDWYKEYKKRALHPPPTKI
jgi:CDP-glucose 4,6-dehydratase